MSGQAMSKTELYAGWKGGRIVVADQPVGARWWVDSTTGSDTAGWGNSPSRPFATVDYAIGNCTASKGDTIYVMPRHEESVASATGMLLDVEGVKVVGLGHGTAVPLITLTTAAAATISVTAASCMLKNLRILQAYTGGVTAGITLAATADGCVIEDVTMNETSATEEYLLGISIAAACTDVRITRLRYNGFPAGDTTSAISAIGAADNLIIEDCYINVDASAAAVKLDAAASLNLLIRRNKIIQMDTSAGLGVNASDTATGFMHDNRIMNLLDAVEGFTGDLMCYGENFCSNVQNKQGFYLPAQDS